MHALAEADWRGERTKEGIRLFARAAARGHVGAFWTLGVHHYYNARGERREAMRWWRRGAELGCDLCAASLAEVYDEGELVRRNPAKAFALRSQIKTPEYRDLDRMARALWDGDGVASDRVAAVDMFFRAHIEAGSPEADIHLGDLFRDGLGGLPRDLAEAIAWYQATYCAEWRTAHAPATLRLQALGVAPSAYSDEDTTFDEDELEEAAKFWRPQHG